MDALPSALEKALRSQTPTLWLNSTWRPIGEVEIQRLHFEASRRAEAKLKAFAGLFAMLFPELTVSNGIIESGLVPADNLQALLASKCGPAGRWLIKCDHALPVAGSIKARGGFYEVFSHAFDLARRAGLVKPDDDAVVLAAPAARAFFSQHEIAVGSTGNLGLSIGTAAAALGFRAVVHMSAEAKAWKKQRLRDRGVHVVEHDGDYGEAVAAGRRQAASNPNCHFIDDENSEALFLGYSTAAIRLRQQLDAADIAVDGDHPLFVYLPCGVGGAPGGITFGLRHVFGDHVHCFFAEPTAAPAVLVGLASPNAGASAKEFGLDNKTEADGLAVGKASELVLELVRPLASGVFTVSDDDMLEHVCLAKDLLGLQIEPSAAAGFNGPRWLLGSAEGEPYLARHKLMDSLKRATHILWSTGGQMMPPDIYGPMYEAGQRIHDRRQRGL